MSIMKKLSEVFSPNDPELVQKTLERLHQQDRWNDLFSTKLIEILDKNDALGSELRQKLGEVTATLNQAKNTLSQTRELNTKTKSFCLRSIQVTTSTAGALMLGVLWLAFAERSIPSVWVPALGSMIIAAVLATIILLTRAS